MGWGGRFGKSMGAPLRYNRNNGIMEYWNDNSDEMIFKFRGGFSAV